MSIGQPQSQHPVSKKASRKANKNTKKLDLETLQSQIEANQKLPRFLSVKQLAELLHINEKKVYQLAGEGEIPCTKVTGKWLFPTQLIENWIFQNSHGGVMTDRLVIAGSEDMLVQRVCARAARAVQDTAMISYSPQDTRHGLRMLESGRVDATFINWGECQENALRHMGLLRGHRNHANWVSIRVLQRNQGLIFSSDRVTELDPNPAALSELLSNRKYRWALRAESSGSMRLLQDTCSTAHLSTTELNTSVICDSERSCLAAINTNLADVTCGSEAAAQAYNLVFLPLCAVNLDLVMTRKTYFRTLIQSLLSSFRSHETIDDMDTLKGYKLLDDFRLLTTE